MEIARPLKKLTQRELNKILKAHREWVDSEKQSGEQADLSYTDLSGLTLWYLSGIDFRGANLENAISKCEFCRHADFTNANLKNANFVHVYFTFTTFNDANLENANFTRAYFVTVYFVYANLKNANFSKAFFNDVTFTGTILAGVNFTFADFISANITNADLRGANFCNADVSFADVSLGGNLGINFADAIIDETTKHLNDQCPRTGSFIGYKKACGYGDSGRFERYIIAELEILEDAKRSSATTKKCRCSKAKVLSITNLDGTPAKVKKARSYRDSKFIYTVGEIVEVPNFNEDWREECTTGIHFFTNREDAVSYIF